MTFAADQPTADAPPTNNNNSVPPNHESGEVPPVATVQGHEPALPPQPGSPGYSSATETFNLAARVHPTAAITATSTQGVVAAIEYARRAALPVRVMSTGHGATAKPTMGHSLLVRTRFAGSVRVDPVTRTARVPAGATWAEVSAATTPHGLVAMHGSSGSVGAVGYLLRGGISFYGRRFGLAVNSLRSVTLITASGEQVIAGTHRDPELFWALRGGGGGFGVVTEVEITLQPMAAIVTGATIWAAKNAQAIVPQWVAWAADAPSAISTSLRLMNVPPGPGVPDLLSGGQILVIDGAASAETSRDLEDAQSAVDDLLGPLRAAAAPLLDTWHPAEPAELLHVHMDAPAPPPYAGDHMLLSDLGDPGIASFHRRRGPGFGSSAHDRRAPSTGRILRPSAGARRSVGPGGRTTGLRGHRRHTRPG